MLDLEHYQYPLSYKSNITLFHIYCLYIVYNIFTCTFVHHQIWWQGAVWEGGWWGGEEGDAPTGEWAELCDAMWYQILHFWHAIPPGTDWLLTQYDTRVLRRITWCHVITALLDQWIVAMCTNKSEAALMSCYSCYRRSGTSLIMNL